jgi:hypothetical protein
MERRGRMVLVQTRLCKSARSDPNVT